MPTRALYRLACGGRVLDLGRRTCVMGVLNVTPDSFSDGGRFLDPSAAVAQGERMAAAGADVIDVGGESTRPFSDPVPAAEEIRRVVPVVAELVRRVDVPISIDTTKAEVARRALAAGVDGQGLELHRGCSYSWKAATSRPGPPCTPNAVPQGSRRR